MAGGGAEGEGLDVPVPEEHHLVIPVGHRSRPVVGRSLQGLLVDVEILTNSKPGNYENVSSNYHCITIFLTRLRAN